MPRLNKQRMAARIEGDFVVFLIGMRINRFYRPDLWFPVFKAMPPMLAELTRQRDSGLLGFRNRPGLRNFEVVQYWRSFDHLHRYARSHESQHLPAWVAFNRKAAKSRAVGIWHEMFLVKAGEYEAVYHNMPAYGLGAVAPLEPASGRLTTAAGRLGQSDGNDSPVDDDGTYSVA